MPISPFCELSLFLGTLKVILIHTGSIKICVFIYTVGRLDFNFGDQIEVMKLFYVPILPLCERSLPRYTEGTGIIKIRVIYYTN